MCRMQLSRRRRALPPSPAAQAVLTSGAASARVLPVPSDASEPGRQPAATADPRGYCRANLRRGQVRRPRLAPSAAAAAIAQAAADRVGLAAAAARIEAPAQASHARLRVLLQTARRRDSSAPHLRLTYRSPRALQSERRGRSVSTARRALADCAAPPRAAVLLLWQQAAPRSALSAWRGSPQSSQRCAPAPPQPWTIRKTTPSGPRRAVGHANLRCGRSFACAWLLEQRCSALSLGCRWWKHA
mmetsp:Transcript_70387/g.211677  ORF Transcript_70387/g.211677 Transcript_70387/m.211677 type:complete len:244 (-) Transcript_70387:71-802(-)